MHHSVHIRQDQQLPFDVFQHLSDHWGTILKTKPDSLRFGFSMMLSFDHPSKNLNEGAAEKIQSNFGKSLKVEAIMYTINFTLAIMLTTWLLLGSGHASLPLRNPRQTQWTDNATKETDPLSPHSGVNTIKRHETQFLNCARSLSWSVDTISKTKRGTTKIDRVFAFASEAENSLSL